MSEIPGQSGHALPDLQPPFVPDCGDGKAGLDQAGQNIGRVPGGEKERREIQGR